MSSIQYRDYQLQAREACYDRLRAGVNRQLLVMATGMGKTTCAGGIIENFPLHFPCAGRVLWLTHAEELIEQSALSVLSTLYPEYAKRIRDTVHGADGLLEFMSKASTRRTTSLFDQRANADFQTEALIMANLGIVKQTLFNPHPRLVVASVQTIVNRLDKIPSDWFDIVICDEAHLFMSPTFSKVTNYFTPKLRLGMTATKSRLDGLSLGDLFDEVIIELGLKYGIDNRYLCELEAIILETNVDLTSVKKTAGDLNIGDLSDLVDTPVRNLKIVRKWQESAQGRPTVAYCVNVEHAINLCEAFQQCGVNATFVVADESKCPDRKKRVNDFKKGKYDVITNVGIMVAGFDHPDVGCIIQAAPTMSETKFLQSVGRGTRLKTSDFQAKFGKNNCIIIDVTDNSKRHALVNTKTLDSGKTFEEKVFLGSEERAHLIAQREARKLKHTQEKEETFNLLALPKPIVKMDAPWMKQPPTEKQLQWIATLGWDVVNTTYTRGQVSQIIGSFECSQKEVKWLQENGFDVSAGATKAQYEAAQKIVVERNTTKYFTNTIGKNSPIKGLN